MDKEDRLAARLEETKIILVYGCPNANHLQNFNIRQCNFQTNARAKREAAKSDWFSWIGCGKVLQPCSDIFQLAAPIVINSSALSHATKVYSQRNQTCVVKCTGRPKHNFVMHRAAPKRMRMKHKRNS